MRSQHFISTALISTLLLFGACKKKDKTTEPEPQPQPVSSPPQVTTTPASFITEITAKSGGNITNGG
ncbi:MAG: hypothetical protein ABIP51_19890, partial [Bacteroidia bacterium]